MDLLAILNLEDAPPYGRPSTPSVSSGSSAGTPTRYSSSVSFVSLSEDNGRHKSLEDLRSKAAASDLVKSKWSPPQFTAIHSPKHGHCQDASLYSIAKSACVPLESIHCNYIEEHSRGGEVTQHAVTHESYQTQMNQGPCVESTSPSSDIACTPLRLSNYLQSPFRSLPSSQRSQRSRVRSCSSESINLHHKGFSRQQTTRDLNEMPPSSPMKLPGISEILKPSFLTQLSIQSDKPVCHQSLETQISPAKDEYPSSDDIDDGNSEEETQPSVVNGSQKCTYMNTCNLESPDRRVISHFFGRNKKETRAIPDECWVCYCRQHYQRARYRQSAGMFAQTQMRLVKETVEKLEDWKGVVEWNIAIRKRNAERIAQEDVEAAQAEKNNLPAPEKECRERVLQPYVGKNKTFDDVYEVIAVVEDYSKDNQCEALEFEVVPQYRPGYLSSETPNKRRATKATRPSTQRSSKVTGCAKSKTVTK